MKDLKGIRTLTVDIRLPNSFTSTDDSFRVFLSNGSNGKWLPIILIVSRGITNPLDYAEDTYQIIEELIIGQELEISKCSIYVDLMECLGIRSNYLFSWSVDKEKGGFASNIAPVSTHELTEFEVEVLRNYYEDRWSLFTESGLTNEEKAEMVANALADSIYDEKSVEGVQLAIRFKLLEVIRNGINLSSILFARLISGCRM